VVAKAYHREQSVKDGKQLDLFNYFLNSAQIKVPVSIGYHHAFPPLKYDITRSRILGRTVYPATSAHSNIGSSLIIMFEIRRIISHVRPSEAYSHGLSATEFTMEAQYDHIRDAVCGSELSRPDAHRIPQLPEKARNRLFIIWQPR
jgi:hypothetical protein